MYRAGTVAERMVSKVDASLARASAGPKPRGRPE